jgi:hypothetical protein
MDDISTVPPIRCCWLQIKRPSYLPLRRFGYRGQCNCGPDPDKGRGFAAYGDAGQRPGLLAVASGLKRFVKRKYRIKKNSRTRYADLLRERWAGIGHSVARFVRDKSDILVITLFLNLRTVAVYSLYAR